MDFAYCPYMPTDDEAPRCVDGGAYHAEGWTVLCAAPAGGGDILNPAMDTPSPGGHRRFRLAELKPPRHHRLRRNVMLGYRTRHAGTEANENPTRSPSPN